jgi:predicted alpha/beta-fold hydrolase
LNSGTHSYCERLQFQPPPIARNRHVQTLLSVLGSSRVESVSSKSHHVAVDESDAVGCEESCHPDWQPYHPTVLLVHGMGGTHLSPYMVRMARKLITQPYRVIRMNLRGCGTSAKLCRRTYHGGLSNDVWQVLRHFHALAPHSPTTVVAYSMGANMTLKMAGEQGKNLANYVKSVIAVCPPFYLNRCLDKMRSFPFSVYDRYLVNNMRRQYQEWAAHHPYLKHPEFPAKMNITDFDDLYTLPYWKFNSIEEYHRQSSCASFIGNIDVPCHIVCAADDPIVDTETIHTLNIPKCVRVWESAYGGHMGFVGAWDSSSRHWLDQVLLDLIDAALFKKTSS